MNARFQQSAVPVALVPEVDRTFLLQATKVGREWECYFSTEYAAFEAALRMERSGYALKLFRYETALQRERSRFGV